MDKSLLIGTNNDNKLKEIVYLLNAYNFELYTPKALKLNSPEETGRTFEENAKLKALYYASHSGMLSISEDSGLCVEDLADRPGIHTSNWVEEEGSIENLFLRIKKELERVGAKSVRPKASFRCSVAIYDPIHKNWCESSAEIRGYLNLVMLGSDGFGYDPFFIPEGDSKTLAQMSFEEKISISPRTKAINESLMQLKL